jgi:hypothetical protein
MFIEDDYRDTWNSNLRRLNMDVFASMISIFRKFVGLHMDVVRWCRDITLNQYAYTPELFETVLCRNPRIRKQREEERERQRLLKEEEMMKEPQAEGPPPADDPDEEILEHDLDDEALNKRIKDVFDLDIPQMKQDIQAEQ